MAKKIKGITIEIGAETQPLKKALAGVNKQSKELQGELRQVDRLLKLDPKNSDLLAQRQKLLGEAVANTTDKLETLREAQRQVQQQFERGEVGEEQYRAIQREVIATEQNLRRLETQLNETNNSWRNAAENLERFGQRSTEVGKSMTMKVTAPILGIGAAASKIGLEFEAAMSEVQATSGATGDELEQLEKAARDAGSTTSKSATDAAAALEYMSLAGWDTTTSIKSLMPVLRLSEAGALDLGRASDLVTDSMSSLGLSADELQDYLDKVAKTSSSSNTNIDALMEAMVIAGGTFKNLNVPLDEANALLGILANRGKKGSEAGNALNSIMVNLTSGAGQAGDAMAKLGISAFDSEGNFKGMANVLQELGEKTADMTEEQKTMYLSMIGGKTQLDTLQALLSGVSEEYEGLRSNVASADGALEKMAKTMQDNNKGSITALLSALEELALKIYDVLQPAIAWLIEKIQGLVKLLNNLSPGIQTTIVILAGLVAAIGPLLLILGQMSLGISSLITLFGTYTAATTTATAATAGATTATGGLAGAMAVITGPIGIAVAAIVGITAVIVALWKTNEEFRENVKAIWEQIKEIFTLTIEYIKGVINGGYEAILRIWEKYGEKIKIITKTIWDVIANTINSALKVIQGLLDVFIGLFTGDWKRLGEGIKTIWQGLWDAIEGIVKGAWGLLSSAFGDLASEISNWFTGLASSAYRWGKNMLDGFIDGIKSKISNLGKAVSGVAGVVSDYIGFNSPAKKGEGRFIEDWGYNMIDGFMDGMNKALPELQMSLNSVIPNMGNTTNTTTNSTNNNSFVVNAVIREESDIKKVARELYMLQQNAARGVGVR